MDATLGAQVDAAATAVRAARTDSMYELGATIVSTARKAGLTVIPALLPQSEGAGTTVLLDPDFTSADEFVAAAVSSGTTLLFMQTLAFEPEDCITQLRDLGPVSGVGSIDRLVTEVERLDGWNRSLEVAFAHEGVLVTWVAEPPWLPLLDDLLDALPAAGERIVDHEGTGDEPERLDEAATALLAGRLAACRAFREAQPADREAAARVLPELAALWNARDSWDVDRVLRQADLLVAAETNAAVDRLAPRRDELAALLVEDSGFARTRTTYDRIRFAQDWLLDHADGLRLPIWWVKELVAATKTPRRQLTLRGSVD